ncbi:MAG: glucosaminidase domain-containing protein, partial [Symbiobacteriaceae bacterium]|nr:glucosaminidase domain-containing protein [Symbiobacteriaceae bacterium]
GSPPAGGSQTRYYFLDPISGTGKIVAMSSSADGAAQWLPDLTFNGSSGILAATILGANGVFLMGTAAQVHLALTPKVELMGLVADQQMTGEIQMSMSSNFTVNGVEYEFSELSTGSSTRSPHTDPDGVYTHYPPAGQTGRIGVRAIAFDALGNPHRSEQVIILAQVPEVDNTPYVRLHNFAVADVGKVPVTLAISRNFDVDSTQYWVISPWQNQEEMLKEVPWGDYRWFPGPEMAGEWDVFVRVVATDGQIHTSNPIRVTVPDTPSIVLQGAGPGQVVTGELELSSLANVPLQRVEYRIRNPSWGSYEVIGVVSDSADEVVFRPGSEHEGDRRLQAIGTTADGQTIIDEFTVRVYLGELFSAQPLTSREEFISIITPLALQSQRQSGMSAALQVAQAILETGWGQSLPVDRYTGLFSYNLFGIKGRGSAGSVICRTFEEYYGTRYAIDDYFRAYYSVQESWADHKDLLLLAGRYQPFRDVMFNSSRGAYALRRCGYATASTYPDVLKDIIEQYGLDALDWQPI